MQRTRIFPPVECGSVRHPGLEVRMPFSFLKGAGRRGEDVLKLRQRSIHPGVVHLDAQCRASFADVDARRSDCLIRAPSPWQRPAKPVPALESGERVQLGSGSDPMVRHRRSRIAKAAEAERAGRRHQSMNGKTSSAPGGKRALLGGPARHRYGEARTAASATSSTTPAPLGVAVTAFRAPSELELAHDYLWRAHAAVPAPLLPSASLIAPATETMLIGRVASAGAQRRQSSSAMNRSTRSRGPQVRETARPS